MLDADGCVMFLTTEPAIQGSVSWALHDGQELRAEQQAAALTPCVSEPLLQDSALTQLQHQLHLPQTERLTEVASIQSPHGLRRNIQVCEGPHGAFNLYKELLSP